MFARSMKITGRPYLGYNHVLHSYKDNTPLIVKIEDAKAFAKINRLYKIRSVINKMRNEMSPDI